MNLIEPQPTKRCYLCREIKPSHDFARAGANRDGLHSYCRQCMSAYSKAKRKATQLDRLEDNIERAGKSHSRVLANMVYGIEEDDA